MVRTSSLIVALAAALAACGQKAASGNGSNSPLVAKGDGIAITADALKARIDEQSPMIRPAFKQMDAKKMLVDNLLKMEVLAHAAEKAGLQNDPEVQYKIRTVLAAKYQMKYLSDPERVKSAVSDADVAKYYAEHGDEFHKSARVHAAHILVAAEASGAARAKKLAQAKKLLQKVLAEEKTNRAAFGILARDVSDDAATKPMGGDLMYRSADELEKAMGKEFAELAFATTGSDVTATKIVETEKGFHLLHVYGQAPAVDESVDDAKPEITRTLLTQWKAKAFEDLVKQLREELHVTVDDEALASVMPAGVPGAEASAAPPVAPASATAPATTPAPSAR